jgi:hypothetical protein
MSKPTMNDRERMQLSRMLRENDVLDQTPLIRELKHSHIMRSEVNALLALMETHADDPEALDFNIMVDCHFMHTYYLDICNKLKHKQIDVNTLFQFLDALQRIEDNETDQHEASFEVGTILKKLYVDGAVRQADAVDAALAADDDSKSAGKKKTDNLGSEAKQAMTWAQFKKHRRSR